MALLGYTHSGSILAGAVSYLLTMQSSRMSLPPLLAISGVAANRALLALRLRERTDGWRRAAALLLRGECSTFVLSAFGLHAWSEADKMHAPTLATMQAHVAGRLTAFLAGEPATHVEIERGGLQDFARPIGGPSFTLAFESWIDGPQRFVSPTRWHVQPRGSDSPGALLNIVIRMDAAGRADVWFRINHVGADGVPMQEVISRLEAAWGTSERVVFPTPESFAPHAQARPLSDRPGLCEIQAFIDFGPLLQWRRRQNAKLTEPMTLSSAILWCLSRHVAFRELSIGTTVEVEASGGLKRGVGVVVVRPGDYHHREGGMSLYVRALNRQIELTRRRASRSCKTLDAAALIGPGPAKAVLRYALDNSPRAFGTIALTMLKDARVFGAPIGEAGHARGFIAIGSVSLPSTSGVHVGCVTIKGPTELVSAYPEFFRQAISSCAALEPGV